MAAEGRSSLASRAAREPTVHFVLLSLVLFAVHAAVRAGRGDVLEVDRAGMAARVAQVESALGGRLTAEERARVEEDYVETLMLAEEARRLGLDGDQQVQELLAQKMLDLLSAEALHPTAEELESFFAARRDGYASPGASTLSEVVVATPGPLPADLARQFADGVAVEELRADVPLQVGVLSSVTHANLVRIVGDETAAGIAEAPLGTWVGPRVTVRGQHWFRVNGRIEASTPRLDEVLGQVRIDWIAEHEQARLDERVAQLRARRRVVFKGGTAP